MIPKIIHHVWPGNDPFRYPEFRKTWMTHNPDYTFMFWRLDNLPLALLMPTTLQIVNAGHFPIVTLSDILRWEVLRIFGGVYVDTDMVCLQSFDKLLDCKSFCGKATNNVSCNAIMGALPNDKNVTDAVNVIGKNLIENPAMVETCLGVLKSSGPKATRVMQDSMEVLHEPHMLYTSEINKPMYSFHYWKGSQERGWAWMIKNRERQLGIVEK